MFEILIVVSHFGFCFVFESLDLARFPRNLNLYGQSVDPAFVVPGIFGLEDDTALLFGSQHKAQFVAYLSLRQTPARVRIQLQLDRRICLSLSHATAFLLDGEVVVRQLHYSILKTLFQLNSLVLV